MKKERKTGGLFWKGKKKVHGKRQAGKKSLRKTGFLRQAGKG